MFDLLVNLNPSGWNQSISPCNWTGVSCDPVTQHITVIKLDNMNLQGTIPTSIGWTFIPAIF